MKQQARWIAGAAIAAALLAGCGHGSSGDMTAAMGGTSSSSGAASSSSSSSSSSGSSSSSSSSSSSGGMAMMVDTQDVLAIARMPSETGLPFGVDAGYTFTDTSEISPPISVQ